MASATHIIAIDLGTTNCTMAYLPLSNHDETSNSKIEQFSISQMTQSGIQGNHFSLPSFIYFPLQEEISAKMASLDWDPHRSFIVGTLARDRGAELPSRLISSAKSWLCHSSLDRR